MIQDSGIHDGKKVVQRRCCKRDKGHEKWQWSRTGALTVRTEATQEKCMGQENGCMTEGLQVKGIHARRDRIGGLHTGAIQDRRESRDACTIGQVYRIWIQNRTDARIHISLSLKFWNWAVAKEMYSLFCLFSAIILLFRLFKAKRQQSPKEKFKFIFLIF